MNNKSVTYILKALGPGILYAGAAIGASHLVQATRFGATYGFSLTFLIILALLFKYPFYFFGPKYFTLTGKNLLHGYQAINKWALWFFALIALVTFIPALAIVSFVAAHLFAVLLPQLGISSHSWLLIITLFSVLWLSIGHYALLDKSVKIIIAALTIMTLLVFYFAVTDNSVLASNQAMTSYVWKFADLWFILAVIGWMPAPLDSSILTSLWVEKKEQVSTEKLKSFYIMTDFNIGYLITSMLALIFVALGALVMFNNETQFSESGIAFTQQLIQIYSSQLGAWSAPVIGFIAAMVMWSTLLTLMDGFPRTLSQTCKLLMPRLTIDQNRLSWWILIAMVSLTLLLVMGFVDNLLVLVDGAMLLTFLTTPLLAYFNYKAIQLAAKKVNYQLPLWLRILTYSGLVFLLFFVILFFFVWIYGISM